MRRVAWELGVFYGGPMGLGRVDLPRPGHVGFRRGKAGSSCLGLDPVDVGPNWTVVVVMRPADVRSRVDLTFGIDRHGL